jgi:hypothetical protein
MLDDNAVVLEYIDYQTDVENVHEPKLLKYADSQTVYEHDEKTALCHHQSIFWVDEKSKL